ncbi:hypothetical protein EMN47_04940 [Prolixibacteraceae bacterium JC049]|nr:hypothetical protein [Prolixibacteraceae bacterium JC049]
MRKLFYFIVALGVFTSCLDAEDNKSAVGDIYTECIRTTDNQLKYAPVMICQSNTPLDAVTVNHSTFASPLSLTAFDSYKTTFAKVPGETDYKTDKPVTGLYTYNVTFAGGETKEMTENLKGEVVEPPVIVPEGTKWNSEKNQLDFDWNDVTNFDYYSIRLYTIEDEEKKVYVSPLFKNASSYEVKRKQNDKYWAYEFTPNNNQEFKYEVVCYKMEEGTTSRLEGIARTKGLITWVGSDSSN